jgi:hypothetical protein
MDIKLYRYPHPVIPEKWIYIGQTRRLGQRDGEHRIGKEGFGKRFKKVFPQCILPTPEFFGETITNKGDADFAETVEIFKHHTWWGYPDGMNLTLPGSVDYENIGRIGGRKAVKSGQLASIKTFETCSKGGKIGGKISGRKNVETGHMDSMHTIDNQRKGGRKNIESGHITSIATKESCSKGGKIGGRKGGLKGGPIGMCQRWNINRGKPCTCGKHQKL